MKTNGITTSGTIKKESTNSLIEAVKNYESGKITFDPNVLRSHAEQFDEKHFKAHIMEFVKKKFDKVNF